MGYYGLENEIALPLFYKAPILDISSYFASTPRNYQLS